MYEYVPYSISTVQYPLPLKPHKPHQLSLPSCQLVQFTHLLAFSLIYFLQNLHLTCFFTISVTNVISHQSQPQSLQPSHPTPRKRNLLSSVPRLYPTATTQSVTAMAKNLTTLSKKFPYANTTAPSASACSTVLYPLAIVPL